MAQPPRVRERLIEVFHEGYPPSASYGEYTNRDMPLVVLERAEPE